MSASSPAIPSPMTIAPPAGTQLIDHDSAILANGDLVVVYSWAAPGGPVFWTAVRHDDDGAVIAGGTAGSNLDLIAVAATADGGYAIHGRLADTHGIGDRIIVHPTDGVSSTSYVGGQEVDSATILDVDVATDAAGNTIFARLVLENTGELTLAISRQSSAFGLDVETVATGVFVDTGTTPLLGAAIDLQQDGTGALQILVDTGEGSGGVLRYAVDAAGTQLLSPVASGAEDYDAPKLAAYAAGSSVGLGLYLDADTGGAVVEAFDSAASGPVFAMEPWIGATGAIATADIAAQLYGTVMVASWAPGYDGIRVQHFFPDEAGGAYELGTALVVPVPSVDTIVRNIRLEDDLSGGPLLLSWEEEDAAGNTVLRVTAATGVTVGGTQIGDAGVDALNGTEDLDWLDGRGGNDTLNGNGGPDWIFGGFDTDAFNGGEGFDTYIIRGSTVDSPTIPFDIDLGAGTDSYGNTYSSIERILGGGAADTVHAGTTGIEFHGGGGADTFFDGAGNDLFFGGEGVDAAHFGAGGLDGADGGAGFDTLDFSGAGGPVFIHGADFRNFEDVTGSGFADYLVRLGDYGPHSALALGATIQIDGGGGGDIFIAGEAAEAFEGGSGADTVSYFASDAGISYDLFGTIGGGFAEGDGWSSIETVIGSEHADFWTARPGAPAFRGGGGDDTFFADEGVSINFNGGEGTDTLSFFSFSAGVTAGLDAGGAALAGGIGGFSNVETLAGSGQADVFTIGAVGQSASGAGGADTFFANGRFGAYDGGGGDDLLDLSGLGGIAAGEGFASDVRGVETLRGSALSEIIEIGESERLDWDRFRSIELLGGADALTLWNGDGLGISEQISLGAGDDRLRVTGLGLYPGGLFAQAGASLDGGADEDVLELAVDPSVGFGTVEVDISALAITGVERLEASSGRPLRVADVWGAGGPRFEHVAALGGAELTWALSTDLASVDLGDLGLGEGVALELISAGDEVFMGDDVVEAEIYLTGADPVLYAGAGILFARHGTYSSTFNDGTGTVSYRLENRSITIIEDETYDRLYRGALGVALGDYLHPQAFEGFGTLELTQFDDFLETLRFKTVRTLDGDDTVVIADLLTDADYDLGTGDDLVLFTDDSGFGARAVLDGGADHDVLRVSVQPYGERDLQLFRFTVANFEALDFEGEGLATLILYDDQLDALPEGIILDAGVSLDLTIAQRSGAPGQVLGRADALTVLGDDPDRTIAVAFLGTVGADTFIAPDPENALVFTTFQLQADTGADVAFGGGGVDRFEFLGGQGIAHGEGAFDTAVFTAATTLVSFYDGGHRVIGGAYAGSSLIGVEEAVFGDEQDVVELSGALEKVSTGGENDLVRVLGARAEVALGAGEDIVEVGPAYAGGGLIIDGGEGEDRLALRGLGLPGYTLDLSGATLSGLEHLGLGTAYGDMVSVRMTGAQLAGFESLDTLAGFAGTGALMVDAAGPVLDLSGLMVDAPTLDLVIDAPATGDFEAILPGEGDGFARAEIHGGAGRLVVSAAGVEPGAAARYDGSYFAGDGATDMLRIGALRADTPILFQAGTAFVIDQSDDGDGAEIHVLHGFEIVEFADGSTVDLDALTAATGLESETIDFALTGFGEIDPGTGFGFAVETIDGQEAAAGPAIARDAAGARVGTVELTTDLSGAQALRFTPDADAFADLDAGMTEEITIVFEAVERIPGAQPTVIEAEARFTVEGENEPAPGAVIGEVRQVTLTDGWTSLSFDNTYVDPVVFLLSPSLNEAEAVATRLRNITSTGAEARLQETKLYLGERVYDGHLDETATLVVLEKGRHMLADGTVLEVGELTTNKLYVKGFESIAFESDFADTPAIFSQIQSFNGSDWVIGRHDAPSADGFLMTMQEEQADNLTHGYEDVGWFAIEKGAFDWGGIAVQASSTGAEVNQRLVDIDFLSAFDAAPIVAASIATYAGSDPGSPRIAGVDAGGFVGTVVEDQSFDEELQHNREILDWIAFGGAGDLTALPALPAPVALSAPAALALAVEEPLAALETGIATVNDRGLRIEFAGAHQEALVFAAVTTSNGMQQVMARVSEVDDEGFFLKLEEAPGLDGRHVYEEVSWVAVEAGTWALENGAAFSAGTGAAGGTAPEDAALFAQVQDGSGFAPAWANDEAGPGFSVETGAGGTAAWLALWGDGFDFGLARAEGTPAVAQDSDAAALLLGATGAEAPRLSPEAGGDGDFWWAAFEAGALFHGEALV